MKGEEDVKDDTHHRFGFIDEYLEEAINTSNIYESRQETDHDYWILEHNSCISISINNTFHN